MLGIQLRRLREAAGITREAAAETIRAHHTKISRLELGRVGFKQRDLADLLAMYRMEDEQQREALFSLARLANAPGWWQRDSDLLPHWFEMYLGLEDAASIIRTYELQLIPGIVQTADYAREAFRVAQTGVAAAKASRGDVDQRVRLLMERRDRLDRRAPRRWIVLDESALRRPLGGTEVLRRQLEHLIELAEARQVTLQVIPFRARVHAAAGMPFSILRFSEPDLPDIVYLEQLTSALYLDKPQDIDYYSAVWDSLAVVALPALATPAFLRGIVKEL